MAEEEHTRWQMGPTYFLPQKVAESIFKLLPVKDILSCCLVSSSWRDAINTDNIWKPFCNANINLENVPCVMKQKCTNHQNKNLTSVCANRLKYMQEISLRNNFKYNRRVDYQIKMKNLVCVSTIHFVNNYRFLILNSVEGRFSQNCFEVWDLEHAKAPFYVQRLRHLLKQNEKDEFMSIGDCLLIIQGNLFQMYTAVEGKLTLKFCRVTNREEAFSHFIPASDKIEAWYSENVRSMTLGFQSEIETVTVADRYLFGLFRSLLDVGLNRSVIHIWDWKSGNKLKIERLPEISENIDLINFDKTSQHLYILMFVPSSILCCRLYSLELKRLIYTEFYLAFPRHTYHFITEEMVILFCCKQYKFLDTATGNVIVGKEARHPIDHFNVDTYHSVLAFVSGSTVTVVDLRTYKEVAVLQVNMIPTTIFFVESNLLLVGGSSAGNNSLEVWDIKKRCKLYRMNDTLLMSCGRSLLRLCILKDNKIHVLNYW